MPVDKTPGKAPSKTTAATNSTSASTMTSSDTVAAAGVHDALQQPAMVADADCVFNDQTLQQQQRISDAQRDIMKVLTLISWTLIAALIMIAGLASVLLQVQKEDSVKTQIEKRCIQPGGS